MATDPVLFSSLNFDFTERDIVTCLLIAGSLSSASLMDSVANLSPDERQAYFDAYWKARGLFEKAHMIAADLN